MSSLEGVLSADLDNDQKDEKKHQPHSDSISGEAHRLDG